MGKKLVFILFFMFFTCANIFAQESPLGRDYLYSEAYFDYLIEMANEEAFEAKEQEKKQQKKQETLYENEEITAFENNDEEDTQTNTFKLRIEENLKVNPYSETFKKPETKISIPASDKFSFTYAPTQYINKNYTDGRRLSSGIEYAPFKNLKFETGLETNYRDVDQNPLSRKIYFTPAFKVNDYFTVSFLNKYNFNDYSDDHDIGLYFTPSKTKAIDFKIFAGISNEHSGVQSQSASFYTNFYFF